MTYPAVLVTLLVNLLPMCLSAIYWAKIPTVFYAATRIDAHDAGFDDYVIYKELDLHFGKKIAFKQIMRR